MGTKPEYERWIELAEDVLRGKYDRAAQSELEALWIGLHALHAEVFRRARARIESLIAKRKTPNAGPKPRSKTRT